MTRFSRIVLRLLPPGFRDRHGRDLLELYEDAYLGQGRFRRVRFWARVLGDALLTAFSARLQSAWREISGRTSRGSTKQLGPRRSSVSSRIAMSMSAFWHDLRYALRTLRKRPLFTGVSVLTLGLGIGAATAVFSVVDGVLLKPPRYEDPTRLVNVWEVDHELREVDGGAEYWDRGAISYPRYRAWRAATTLFENAAAHRSLEVTLTGQGRPQRMTIGIVSSSLFPLLGVQPSLGRWFLPNEEAPTPGDGATVAILSHEMWRATFSADPDVLGTSVVIDDRPYTVVGVMPRGFRLRRLGARSSSGIEAAWAQLWVPIGVPGVDLGPGAGHWEALGRLHTLVSTDDALAEARRLLLADPDGTRRDVQIVPRARAETRGVGSGLVLLLGATGLLMMIACANTATLLLGENHGRRHEVRTRFALGASGGRVVRQLLTESTLLGVGSSVVGVLLAFGGTRLLTVLAPPLPRLDEVAVDVRVLVVAIALGLLSGLLFGAVPALTSAKNALGEVSRTGRQSTGRGNRLERGLVSLEIALTTVILVGCGLFVQSLSNLLSVDPGFESGDLMAAHVTLSQGRYPTDPSRAVFYREALNRIRAIPGVTGASATDNLLFPAQGMNMDMVRIPGATAEAYSTPFIARFSVAPDYFSLMGIPLLAGRHLTEADDAPDAQPVMVISETMANRYWPGESPIGASVRHWLGETTVVGVVGDVRFQRLDTSPSPTMFVPMTPTGSRRIDFIVDVEGDPAPVVPQVREAIWSVDGEVPIDRMNTVTSLLLHSGSLERFRTRILLVFGVVATLLAVAGVFGVTARAVALRARELGIRMALGAREVGLIEETLRSGLLTGLVGTVAGLIGAYLASSLLSRFLFGVDPSDAPTYVLVSAILMLVCLVASFLPARRIARVDPVEVLRAE